MHVDEEIWLVLVQHTLPPNINTNSHSQPNFQITSQQTFSPISILWA